MEQGAEKILAKHGCLYMKDDYKALFEELEAYYKPTEAVKNNAVLPFVSGSAWERKLVGKNIHSVFTWCKDCGMKGCNIPFENECGNCGSKNTVRYYDAKTIDLLF